MTRFICAALATAAIFSGVTAASAEDAQMHVKVTDINLTTDAGAKSALARIRFSAAQFCERDAGRQSLERTALVERCVAEMTRKGVDGLNAPLVTALLRREAPARAQTQVASAE